MKYGKTYVGHKQLSGNLRKALPELRKVGFLEYTIPDKPNSRLQKYRLTEEKSGGLSRRKLATPLTMAFMSWRPETSGIRGLFDSLAAIAARPRRAGDGGLDFSCSAPRPPTRGKISQLFMDVP